MFRLEPISRAMFDVRLERIGPGKLTRAAAATYLESECGIDDATYHLASVGVRATTCSSIPGPASALRLAIAFDLRPLDDALQAIDVVEFRPIPLSDVSATLMGRRFPWSRRSREARDTCRRLLREEDAVLGWRRVLWISVASLRAARACVRLRPVVFDRAAVERQPLRWTYANDGIIGRWAFT